MTPLPLRLASESGTRRLCENGRTYEGTYIAATRKEQLKLIEALKWTVDLSQVAQIGIREFHPKKGP